MHDTPGTDAANCGVASGMQVRQGRRGYEAVCSAIDRTQTRKVKSESRTWRLREDQERESGAQRVRLTRSREARRARTVETGYLGTLHSRTRMSFKAANTDPEALAR